MNVFCILAWTLAIITVTPLVPIAVGVSLSRETERKSVAESRGPALVLLKMWLHSRHLSSLKWKKTHCDIQGDLVLCGAIRAAGKWVAYGTHRTGIQYLWWAGLQNASQRDERIVQRLHKRSSSSPVQKRLGIEFSPDTWLISGWKYFAHSLSFYLHQLLSCICCYLLFLCVILVFWSFDILPNKFYLYISLHYLSTEKDKVEVALWHFLAWSFAVL